MASVSQNLKATVSFGGKISSSWRRSASDLRKDLQDVERQSTRLKQEQVKLTAEIKRQKLAGASVKDLKKQYAALTREIHQADTAQAKLNTQLAKSERLDSFKGIGRTLAGRGVNLAKGVGIAIGGGMVASGAAALFTPAIANAETAEQVGLATSYGVDTQTFMQWDSLAKQYGMNGENIGDLFEEYLHKAGEFKQLGEQTALTEAFETLGIKDFELGALSDIAQFEKIIDKALSLEDESKASFALDALLGGEASKLLMLIKRSGKSFDELMREQRKYNLVTKEGADGALKGHRALMDLRTVFSSSIAEISGQLGEELSPTISAMTDDLAAWMRGGGITNIKSFVTDTVFPALKGFGQGVIFVGKVIHAVAKKLAWLLPDERQEQRNLLEMMGQTHNFDVIRRAAEEKGQGEWLDQQLKNNPDLHKDVLQAYIEAKRNRFFLDDEMFKQATEKYLTPESAEFSFPSRSTDNGEWASAMSDLLQGNGSSSSTSMTDNRRYTYQIEVNAAPGQSPESVAEAILAKAKRNDVFNGHNALQDGGDLW
ncbi:hypothetical protein HMPREF1565_1015 [Providencia alcalifaciens RIMD 1656011]|uniref:hypothetical protein n=1 Tax=Providencia alcalifaciens TaxID=126385 RepID=UPI0003E1EAA0|nr:hypothetical protein [Providencia alcalifaciens]ETT01806.1 hypothetical protein HMPREF1568_2822 [Providencia alcalifaciens PAL-3]EUD00447.1 hypothetical protein HMPREF1566_1696 [Providencia alcalifaciens PAL-1]EUD04238.1 hypothetical protein HMPREF1565_1015 [Providencia alcalifaciens RIMD 1656011]HEF8786451.1 hypothetical protein [Providencia alcalifaciens]